MTIIDKTLAIVIMYLIVSLLNIKLFKKINRKEREDIEYMILTSLYSCFAVLQSIILIGIAEGILSI